MYIHVFYTSQLDIEVNGYINEILHTMIRASVHNDKRMTSEVNGMDTDSDSSDSDSVNSDTPTHESDSPSDSDSDQVTQTQHDSDSHDSNDDSDNDTIESFLLSQQS